MKGFALFALFAAVPLAAQTPAAAPPAAAAVPVRAVAAEYSYVHLDGGADPWHLGTVELSRRSPAVALVARASLAERFGQRGAQGEIDAYPRISERVYAYANVGVSGSDLFPRLRYGGELYGNFARGIEASGGFRRLEFDDEGVTLWTGSVGKYAGNYYASARPFVTRRNGATAVSGTLLARRYFSGPRSFATLVVGAGSAPSEAPLAFELRRTDSQRVGVYGTTPLRGPLAVRWSAGWEREELTAADTRTRISTGIGAEVRF
ncbi:MAG TPA: YaiO family outer membrane beta-barrel protein [Longimicrobium sp.]|nr:YaiO family outer membrane beta-barrel protein [Longimicrobium sp.]